MADETPETEAPEAEAAPEAAPEAAAPEPEPKLPPKEALRLAGQKLPVKTKFVRREADLFES